MAEEQLRTLEPGTPVIVTMDDGSEWHTRTRSYKPWALGCGRWVVALEGKRRGGYSNGAGGFDLERVRIDGHNSGHSA